MEGGGEAESEGDSEAVSTVIVCDSDEHDLPETSTSSAASYSPPVSNHSHDNIESAEANVELDGSPSIIPIKHISGSTAENAKEKEEELEFDPDSLIYMANACCELLHYRSAAVVVAILEILMMLVWLAFCFVFYKAVGVSVMGQMAVGGQAVVAAIMLGAIGLTFAGVKMERPSFLWPHMVIQIIGISIGIILTVIAVISMAAGTHIAEAVFGVLFGRENLPKVEQALGPIWPFCLAVIFDFGAAIGIWFYILVRGCYDYLLDKKFFESVDNSGIQLDIKREHVTVQNTHASTETKA